MTDIAKVIIAAQACILVLGLGIEAYRNVEIILVYPSTVIQRLGSIVGTLQPAGEPTVVSSPRRKLIAGQASGDGTIILCWDAVLRGGRDGRDGSNVVFHEFAHVLDMYDGAADGIPPCRTRTSVRKWLAVIHRDYEALARNSDQGRDTFLGHYAATSPAEFFAVATERFFEQPKRLKQHHDALYALMAEFYQQDPVARVWTRFAAQEPARGWARWQAIFEEFRPGFTAHERLGLLLFFAGCIGAPMCHHRCTHQPRHTVMIQERGLTASSGPTTRYKTPMKKVTFVVASDVNPRDGIGVELYLDAELQVEVFRDDTLRRRYVTLFKDEVDLEYVEQCIQKFKQENIWEFIDYDDTT